MSMSAPTITRYFRRLRDPRRKHLKQHDLMDIIVIAICAVIAGANDWQQVATFGRSRQAWLERFLTLSNGIPSHDTFERVFDRLDPPAFQACFQQWIEALARGLGLNHIAIDGKTLRGSANDPKGWKPLHLVSAWATECQLSLGQVAVDEKSNEITAIPQLLELLDIKGALVTIDAMGCQKEIAKKIIEQGGDYVLPVKDNQPNLLEDIQATLAKAMENEDPGKSCDTYETFDHAHGRKEKRTCVIVIEPQDIRNANAWEKLSIIGMIVREREIQGKRSDEISYFIGSRVMSAHEYLRTLRNHWGIENNLHWQMDVTFREDGNRVQKRHGAENLALVRRLALGLLKKHPSKLSIACKRLEAALNSDFLEEILLAGAKVGEV